MKALSQVCSLVHEELSGIVDDGEKAGSSQTYDESGRIWRSVQEELDSCEVTMKKLQHIVDQVEKEGNVFRQTSRQVRLNWRKEEVEVIRQNVQIHTQNLQISL